MNSVNHLKLFIFYSFEKIIFQNKNLKIFVNETAVFLFT